MREKKKKRIEREQKTEGSAPPPARATKDSGEQGIDRRSCSVTVTPTARELHTSINLNTTYDEKALKKPKNDSSHPSCNVLYIPYFDVTTSDPARWVGGFIPCHSREVLSGTRAFLICCLPTNRKLGRTLPIQ